MLVLDMAAQVAFILDPPSTIENGEWWLCHRRQCGTHTILTSAHKPIWPPRASRGVSSSRRCGHHDGHCRRVCQLHRNHSSLVGAGYHPGTGQTKGKWLQWIFIMCWFICSRFPILYVHSVQWCKAPRWDINILNIWPGGLRFG
jgi:hypothetical protein